MTDDAPKLGHFIELGQTLFHLSNPQAAIIENYIADVQRFLELLEQCGLNRTRKAAAPLDGATVYSDRKSRRITSAHADQLVTLSRSVVGVLFQEVAEKSLVITDIKDVPNELVDLPARMGVESLEPHQEAMRQDVITCFKTGAYRPAIVVAWALGFDLMRWWVYSDTSRRSDFNQLLRQRNRQEIVNYSDFFSVREATVLEICRDAVGSLREFTSKTHRLLENLLDDRNAFAHANFENATHSQSSAYIERLFRVLTKKPFT